MADNVAITAGSGTSVAADDIGSVFYQRVKVSHGADGAATDTSSASPLPVRQGGATATLANVSGATSSTTLISSNADRRAFVIYNDSSAILYVKFGSTASSTSFTYYLAPGATLESQPACYTGIITGIWASATGSARTTEIAA